MSFALISCLFDTIFAAQKLMRAVGFLRAGASTLRDPNLGSVGRRLAPILERAAVTTFGTSTRVVHYLGRARHASHPPDDVVQLLAKQPASNSPKFVSMGFCVSTIDPRPVSLGGGFVFSGPARQGAMAWRDQCFPGQARPG